MASDEQQELFGSESTTKEWYGITSTVPLVVVNPELLDGFETHTFSKEDAAKALAHTINGMIDHGASALGLDLDSMFGIVHASGHLQAAMDVGANILNDLAPREDGQNWHQWIQTEFPNAVTAVYGYEQGHVEFARQEMEKIQIPTV